MKIVIVGCGRVGSTLAENLDAAGHEVIIFDVKTAAFDRLPETFKGTAIRGDGTDEEVLRHSGAEGTDVFLSLTEGDNRNVMAAQVATESFGIPQVIAKINDPVRAAAYSELGLVTLCRTNLMVGSVADYLDLQMQTGPGIEIPSTASHEHPHPTATGLSVARDDAATGAAAHATATDAPASKGGERDVRSSTTNPGGPASPKNAPNEAEAAQTQRLGFRRWRS
ncbi:MAG TPA: TrkA family potassium uptake protein [Candidatus Limnocylindrales bacterium]|jgi:trk system potassium uptake protein TrkA